MQKTSDDTDADPDRLRVIRDFITHSTYPLNSDSRIPSMNFYQDLRSAALPRIEGGEEKTILAVLMIRKKIETKLVA